MDNYYKQAKDAEEYKNVLISRVAKKCHPFMMMTLDVPMFPKYTRGQLTLLWEKFHEYRDAVGRNIISYPMLVKTSFGSTIIAYLTDSINAAEIKSKSIHFEDHDHYGKILNVDIFVVEKQGPRKIERNECNATEKKCVVCNKASAICLSSGIHTKEQIRSRMLSYVEEYNVVRCANNAFYECLVLDPKPGIVSPSSKGTIPEVDFDVAKKSFMYLSKHLWGFYRIYPITMAEPDEAISEIREMGITIEKQIFNATRGVLPHKGLNFLLSNILYSAGFLYFNGQLRFVGAPDEFKSFDTLSEVIKDLSQNIFDDYEMEYFKNSKSREMSAKYGMKGLRGELSLGLPSVFVRSLPFFINQMRATSDREFALKRTLVFLMSFIDDTGIVWKAGPTALDWLKKQANDLINSTESSADGSMNKDKFLKSYDNFCLDVYKNDLAPTAAYNLLIVTYLFYGLLFMKRKGIA